MEDLDLILQEPETGYDAGKDFTTLVAWKDAKAVQLFFYRKVVPLIPDIEKNNLNIQIRKCSVSITANIAEGYGRFHRQEAMQFFRISRASLYELKDHIITCADLNFVSEEISEEGTALIEQAKRTINGYIAFLKRNK